MPTIDPAPRPELRIGRLRGLRRARRGRPARVRGAARCSRATRTCEVALLRRQGGSWAAVGRSRSFDVGTGARARPDPRSPAAPPGRLPGGRDARPTSTGAGWRCSAANGCADDEGRRGAGRPARGGARRAGPRCGGPLVRRHLDRRALLPGQGAAGGRAGADGPDRPRLGLLRRHRSRGRRGRGLRRARAGHVPQRRLQRPDLGRPRLWLVGRQRHGGPPGSRAGTSRRSSTSWPASPRRSSTGPGTPGWGCPARATAAASSG